MTTLAAISPLWAVVVVIVVGAVIIAAFRSGRGRRRQ
jgi:hypothetical protein